MKIEKLKKICMCAGITTAIIVSVFGMSMFIDFNNYDFIAKNTYDEPDHVTKWYVIAEINSYNYMLAENSPTGGGWLSTFCLDYAETPATCLQSNATNGAYNGWANVSGYVDTDDATTDLESNDPFYPVVRCRFNKTQCYDDGKFIDSRCMINLTLSGDETLAETTLTNVVSFNSTTADYIFINGYHDDAVDGYRITDDGSIAWGIKILAKY